MPVEIRELHIKVTVNQPSQGQQQAAAPSTGAKADDDKEAIISQCVDEILEIIENKKRTITMPTGEFEKLRIISYTDPDFSDEHKGEEYVALINPESYTLETKVEFSNNQGSGTSGNQPRFTLKPPEELAFEFLFDNTGIIDGNPKDDIAEDLQNFKDFLMKYEGDIHQPKFFKLVWGTALMKGICTTLNINYKLFNPDGKPIRAICKVTIRELIPEELRVIEENNQSPDLTHYRIVRKGETLPLLCYRIYGDSKYYIQVAKANKLSDFRNIQPGKEIFFPPISKS